MLKKTIWHMVDSEENGWSFALYSDTGQVVLPDVPTDALALIRIYMILMGAEVRCSFIQEKFDTVRGSGNLYEVPNTALYNGNPGQPMQQAGSGELMRMTSGGTRKKPFRLHGIWDSQIESGQLQTPPGWLLAFNNLSLAVKGLPWGWKGINVNTKNPITAVAATGDNQLLITLGTPLFPGPFDGRTQQVRVKGISSIPKIRNPLVVIPITSTTCTTLRQFIPKPFAAGQMTLAGYALYPCTGLKEIRPTSYKVGKPFRPQAGGRSKR